MLTASGQAARADAVDDYGTLGSRVPFGAEVNTGRRIMVVGDSIQAGTDLTRVTNQASWRLQRYGGVIVHNFASPGATMADTFFLGMAHATTAVQLLHGVFHLYGLVINLGVNDWGQSITVSAFSSAYGAFLDAIPPTIKVACMSPVWGTSESLLNAHGNTKEDYRAAIRAVCDARGATYLEGKDAIPNSSSYFVDGVHPNDRGHKMMGKFLLLRLRDLGWLALR